ncbi:MAG: SDR family oxidoreductase [bacterium]|jgi:NAD(P)-dependent dehydrogenase (short-subunit alcohol dehydrogenase family)|nr:SDR family oxidoreductase [Betaproteobacteria bacterium]
MSSKILLTGASGGFGRLMAQTLLAAGHGVAAAMRDVAGRNRETANALAASGAQVVEMDVCDDASVAAGVALASSKLGGVDVVIHNAGIGVIGLQEAFTADDLKRLFDVNLFGVHRVNRALLPSWRTRRSGLMVNVSSLLGRITMPFYGPYNASKWALEALSENYRSELSGFGIEVCIVEPGGYATSFIHNLMQPSDAARTQGYGEMATAPQAFLEGFERILAATPAQDPQRVADAVAGLVAMPAGQRPLRTTVDSLGMGAAVDAYNQALATVTQGLYRNMGIENMLSVQAR